MVRGDRAQKQGPFYRETHLSWCERWGEGEEGGTEGEEKKDIVWLGSKAVFLSVQTFLLKNIPQVQYLLWSTKLPNVLISTANAAGKQEDRV